MLRYTLNDRRLSGTAKTLILDTANEILVSPASFWEIAIKVSLGKLTLLQPYDVFMDACLNKHYFKTLPIDPKHTAALISLPYYHRDPFDRLIVAQAMVEGIAVISNDSDLDPYPVTRLW
jgi:PIN domain nuclease of toxin-antitoxin system